MNRATLVLSGFLVVASCTASTLRREPEPPRIRCVPVGAVPDSDAWVYVCTFRGDTLPPLPELEDHIAGAL